MSVEFYKNVTFSPLEQTVRCVNQIDEVCRDIEKTINQTIQNTLNHLERDCDEIGSKVDKAIEEDNNARYFVVWCHNSVSLYVLRITRSLPIWLCAMSNTSDLYLTGPRGSLFWTKLGVNFENIESYKNYRPFYSQERFNQLNLVSVQITRHLGSSYTDSPYKGTRMYSG